MIRKALSTSVKFGAVAIMLSALFFANTIKTSPGFLGSIMREIAAVCCDPGIQWMVVLCLAIYFILLSILEINLFSLAEWRRPGNPSFWLHLLVIVALLRYAFAYHTASTSTQLVVFLASVVFGRGISIWISWRYDYFERRAFFLICLLICLFASAALWRTEATMPFQYHGVSRWSGPWGKPNLYGLLMGASLTLATGIGIRECRTRDVRWRKFLFAALCLLAAILSTWGLFKSYSRGAWLGTAFGLACLS